MVDIRGVSVTLFAVCEGELLLGAVRAVGHSLADVGEQNAPDLAGSRRAPELGAGEIEGDGVGFWHKGKHSTGPTTGPNVRNAARRGKRLESITRVGFRIAAPLPATTPDRSPRRREAWGTRGPEFKSRRPDEENPLGRGGFLVSRCR